MIKEKINTTTVRLFFSLWIFILMAAPLAARDIKLQSPDKQTIITITVSDKIYYSVLHNSKPLLKPSPISLTIDNGAVLGLKPKAKHARTRHIDRTIKPVVKEKNARIQDRYNELEIWFEGDYRLLFRAYDDAAAYRFVLDKGKKIKIFDEEVAFTFAGDHFIYFPTEKSFMSHQERMYEYIKLSAIPKEKISSLPALVDIKDGPKVALLEADLEDYPGMYLRGNNNTALTGIFPGVALKEQKVDLNRRRGDRSIRVLEHADYIAITGGKRSLPWRVLAIADEDADLITNQIVYKLASPLKLKDTSWIKPGKVAWDWWNFNNIYGVDFKAGINTRTYKYYIDFASKYGITPKKRMSASFYG
jgi:alpha-glucosidase